MKYFMKYFITVYLYLYYMYLSICLEVIHIYQLMFIDLPPESLVKYKTFVMLFVHINTCLFVPT